MSNQPLSLILGPGSLDAVPLVHSRTDPSADRDLGVIMRKHLGYSGKLSAQEKFYRSQLAATKATYTSAAREPAPDRARDPIEQCQANYHAHRDVNSASSTTSSSVAPQAATGTNATQTTAGQSSSATAQSATNGAATNDRVLSAFAWALALEGAAPRTNAMQIVARQSPSVSAQPTTLARVTQGTSRGTSSSNGTASAPSQHGIRSRAWKNAVKKEVEELNRSEAFRQECDRLMRGATKSRDPSKRSNPQIGTRLCIFIPDCQKGARNECRFAHSVKEWALNALRLKPNIKSAWCKDQVDCKDRVLGHCDFVHPSDVMFLRTPTGGFKELVFTSEVSRLQSNGQSSSVSAQSAMSGAATNDRVLAAHVGSRPRQTVAARQNATPVMMGQRMSVQPMGMHTLSASAAPSSSPNHKPPEKSSEWEKAVREEVDALNKNEKFKSACDFLVQRKESLEAGPKRQVWLCNLLPDCSRLKRGQLCTFIHSVKEWAIQNLSVNPQYKSKLCNSGDQCGYRDNGACTFVHPGDVFVELTPDGGFAQLAILPKSLQPSVRPQPKARVESKRA